jgi:hypothetical protein
MKVKFGTRIYIENEKSDPRPRINVLDPQQV